MLIRNIHDVERTPVAMEGVKDASMALMIGRSHGAPNFSLRSFRVAPGGHTPQHQHDYEHEVYIVSGEGTVLLEGQRCPIREGDVVFVPANHEHQFRVTGDEPLCFLCMVPADRQCGEPTPGS